MKLHLQPPVGDIWRMKYYQMDVIANVIDYIYGSLFALNCLVVGA